MAPHTHTHTSRSQKKLQSSVKRKDIKSKRLARPERRRQLIEVKSTRGLGTTVSAVVVSAVEKIPMITALFETVSAMATVGCSFGLTPNVSIFTKLLLAFLMICGRVGSVTMLLAFSSEKKVISSRHPLDKVQVG